MNEVVLDVVEHVVGLGENAGERSHLTSCSAGSPDSYGEFLAPPDRGQDSTFSGAEGEFLLEMSSMISQASSSSSKVSGLGGAGMPGDAVQRRVQES